jgi:signal transduction histidine kinase
MVDQVTLLLLGVLGLASGLGTTGLPLWRFAVFAVLVVLAYAHGRRLAQQRPALALTATGVIGLVVGAVNFWEGLTALLCLAVFVVLPWLTGRFRHQQAALVHRLQRENDLVAERARLVERDKLATELHDLLGHDLALIALRAGALELDRQLSADYQQRAGELRASAVAATDRLRRTLGALHEPADTVASIVTGARDAGMTVELTESEVDLPDELVCRVVREGLTNAARHAPGAPVTLTLTESAVTISNPVDAAPVSPCGTGLRALASHVESVGGRLETDSARGRFTLTVEVPRS